jgi:hypothetical protein
MAAREKEPAKSQQQKMCKTKTFVCLSPFKQSMIKVFMKHAISKVKKFTRSSEKSFVMG